VSQGIHTHRSRKRGSRLRLNREEVAQLSKFLYGMASFDASAALKPLMIFIDPEEI
jgi:hypothetical protein